jgi:hypothetical protein
MSNAIKGAVLSEFSSYASVLYVDLTQWGGPANSGLAMRCTGRTIQVVTARLREPLSDAAVTALNGLMAQMKNLGFERVWYGMAFHYPEVEKNLARASFLVGVENIRMQKKTAPAKEPCSYTLVNISSADDFSPFLGFFEGTRAKSGNSDWSVDPAMVLNLFLHEFRMPHWAECYHWVLRDGKKIGLAAVARGQDLDGQSMGTCTVFVSEKDWSQGGVTQVFEFLSDMLHREGIQKISVACGRDEKARFDFFASIGFAESSVFRILKRDLT